MKGSLQIGFMGETWARLKWCRAKSLMIMVGAVGIETSGLTHIGRANVRVHAVKSVFLANSEGLLVSSTARSDYAKVTLT
jgi:hypothetical protein